jgi:hypothetical protein
MIDKATSLCLIAITLGSLSACTNQVQQSGECNAFLKGLQSDWSFNEETKIFQIDSKDGRRNQDFLTRIDNHKTCLKGLPAKKVKKIFGEPSSVDGTRRKYYLVPSCIYDEFDNCDFLDLEIDEEKGLQSIKLSGQDVQE